VVRFSLKIVGQKLPTCLEKEARMKTEMLQAGEVFIRLFCAVIAGGTIGLNRWLHHKPAGFGTHGLVTLGAALTTLVMIRVPGADAQAASRVIQGLVTGVGFIGAGVIMRENSQHRVHGLTTAASVWASAVLGIACGAADFTVVALGVAFALAILLFGKPCENLVGRIFSARIDD